MLGKNFSRQHEIFLLFSLYFQKIGFDISCISIGDNLHKMSNLFSGKNKKKISLSLAKLAPGCAKG